MSDGSDTGGTRAARAAPVPDWTGEQRFELVERLGAGAMGVVYRARDTERDADVAVKVLRHFDPAALVRFKNEFRSLADVSHPNLVSLYELIARDDQWFLTMELVEGIDFLRYVRRGREASSTSSAAITERLSSSPAERPSLPPADSTEATLPRMSGRGAPRPVLQSGQLVTREQVDRLEHCVIELCRGLRALHARGHLHRDIKPANVLVRDDGHVTILDFGVVTSLAKQQTPEATAHVVGTPAYMAPEQAAGEPLSEASDWYAVGVMMFEAIAGRRPFEGDLQEVLSKKRVSNPPVLDEFAGAVPTHLLGLCAELLARDPDRRPDGEAILRRLGAGVGPSSPGSTRGSAPGESAVIGRDRELSRITDAFRRARDGETTVVRVHGPSGMGKSTILAEALRQLERDEDALVLQARCYERESVPYKAVDGIIDVLSQDLGRMSEEVVAKLLPSNVHALARLFPVLRRIETVLASAALGAPVDPREERREAFGAFRNMMAALCRNRPVVLAIDDFQWADRDSAALLDELLRSPGAPPVLLVVAHRDESWAGSAVLQHVSGWHDEVFDVPVEALAFTEATELARSLLADQSGDAEEIARESGGSPLFVRALVHEAMRNRSSGRSRAVDLDAALRSEYASLPEQARRVLECVAVAGRPLPQAIVRRATGARSDVRSTILRLVTARLLSSSGGRDSDLIETYHDRIRETVVADLAPHDLRAYHRAIARALEASDHPDPEALAEHFAGADDVQRAGYYSELAGDQASGALAFDSAARLYERALALRPHAAREDGSLLGRFGDSLAYGGRPLDAARAYRLAAEVSRAATDAFEFRRRAAEKLLHSGRTVEGIELLGSVLKAVDIPMPETTRGTLASLLWNRFRLYLRGTRVRRRLASELAPVDQMRLESCWSASIGFGMLDGVRAANFQARHLLYALAAGEPRHIIRGLCAEASYLSLEGPRRAARARRILDRAQAVADELGDPIARGYVQGGRGMVSFMTGRWREARESCDRAESVFRAHGIGISWELLSVQIWRLWALNPLGETGELRRRVLEMLRDAEARGDRYTAANVSLGLPSLAWFVGDEPDEARVRIEAAMEGWSLDEGFHFQDYWQHVASMHLDLYEGRGVAAVERMERMWPVFARAMLFRVRNVYAHLMVFRLRAALAALAEEGRDRRRYVREARRWARKLTRQPYTGWQADGLAGHAVLAHLEGDDERAVALLRDSIDQFETDDMPLHAAVARMRLGRILGGDDGGALEAEADRWMRGRDIVAPRRFADIYLPFAG